jgi:hypothetical protein
MNVYDKIDCLGDYERSLISALCDPGGLKPTPSEVSILLIYLCIHMLSVNLYVMYS